MQKLKVVLEQHARWKSLDIYIDRIEAHSRSDFSLCLENSKALLESIGKEICNYKNVDIGANPPINKVLKAAFSAIGYSADHMITQVSSSLANIAQQMGNLRNEIGSTVHGRTLKEIQERNDRVDDLTRELLMDTTEIVASLMIRGFEIENPTKSISLDNDAVPSYYDCNSFNEFWDETFGDHIMGQYSFTASEILFSLDPQVYKTEYHIYISDQEVET